MICKEDSYHTQVRSLTNNSIEWVLEFNERSETKKYATHLRKVSFSFLFLFFSFSFILLE